MENILIIGAHYDDCELGAGGTAARFVAEGKKVYKITLTDTEVYSDDMQLDIKGTEARRNSKDACAILGIKEIEFTPAPYGQLMYTKEMMQELEHVIKVYAIDTVIMHYSEDYNTDHVAAHQICKTAARHCANIFMYQSNPYVIRDGFTPDFFVDITNYIELKRNALKCYQAEHDRQGRLFATNILRNQVWGYGNHVEYAEGFRSIKSLI